MVTIPDLHAALHLVLEQSPAAHGRTSGWQRRAGRISPSQFVQALVWGWLEDPHATLGHLARAAHAAGTLVTPQALSQRFSERSVALLRGVLDDALAVLLQAEPVGVALLAAFPGGVYLGDATQVRLHDDWREAWPGSGSVAALKLATRLDLLRGGLRVALGPARVHDTKTVPANAALPAESLVVEDLGYQDLERLEARRAARVDTLLPLRQGLALRDDRGRRVRLRRWLGRHVGALVERTVFVRGHRLRLVALPVSAPAATRRRQALREEARQHGRPPSAEALALAAWILVLTTVPPERATAAQVGLLMRLRWQIELLFKLWKDQGKLDETRGWNPERIATEWYAKLLGLLLQHWVALASAWQEPERSLVKAGQTIREYARCLALGWREPDTLARLCARIAQSLAVAGRIASHCHRHSSAFRALRA